jgi:DNA-binding Lrp family transcriptional regulator
METNLERAILLRRLRENSRQSLSWISRKEQISLPRLVKCLSKLERGAIKRYFSVLDFRRMGYGLRVLFFVAAKGPGEVDTLILGCGCINSCSRLEKGLFSLECAFRDMKELSDFRERLSESDMAIVQEHFVTEMLKVEGFVAEIS